MSHFDFKEFILSSVIFLHQGEGSGLGDPIASDIVEVGSIEAGAIIIVGSSSTMLEGVSSTASSSGMYPLVVGGSRDGNIKIWQMLVTSVPL